MFPPVLVPVPEVSVRSPPAVAVEAVEEPEVNVRGPAAPEDEPTDKMMLPAVPLGDVLGPVDKVRVPDLVPLA